MLLFFGVLIISASLSSCTDLKHDGAQIVKLEVTYINGDTQTFEVTTEWFTKNNPYGVSLHEGCIEAARSGIKGSITVCCNVRAYKILSYKYA